MAASLPHTDDKPSCSVTSYTTLPNEVARKTLHFCLFVCVSLCSWGLCLYVLRFLFPLIHLSFCLQRTDYRAGLVLSYKYKRVYTHTHHQQTQSYMRLSQQPDIWSVWQTESYTKTQHGAQGKTRAMFCCGGGGDNGPVRLILFRLLIAASSL